MVVLYEVEFEFRNRVDVTIQSVIFLVKCERSWVVMLVVVVSLLVVAV